MSRALASALEGGGEASGLTLACRPAYPRASLLRAPRAKRCHVPGCLTALNNRRDMLTPCRQRRSLLSGIVVPLIDADDASAASRHMVQDCLGHFEADAEALEPGRHSPAKIVQPP